MGASVAVRAFCTFSLAKPHASSFAMVQLRLFDQAHLQNLHSQNVTGFLGSWPFQSRWRTQTHFLPCRIGDAHGLDFGFVINHVPWSAFSPHFLHWESKPGLRLMGVQSCLQGFSSRVITFSLPYLSRRTQTRQPSRPQ